MASTFRLKRKLFFIGPNGEAITGQQLIDMKKKTGGTLKNTLSNIRSENATQNAINTEARAATRNLNKQAHNQFKQLGAAGDKAGISALTQKNAIKGAAQGGFKAGQSSVGAMQGMKNTWARQGTMGKAGIAAGAVAGGYFLGKGLGLWGKKKD